MLHGDCLAVTGKTLPETQVESSGHGKPVIAYSAASVRRQDALFSSGVSDELLA
jgi:hypothetical protein